MRIRLIARQIGKYHALRERGAMQQRHPNSRGRRARQKEKKFDDLIFKKKKN